jgi:DNA polymerase/3'-5' exonuclease PolX
MLYAFESISTMAPDQIEGILKNVGCDFIFQKSRDPQIRKNNILNIFTLFYNYDLLDPNDMNIVADPRFVTTYLQVNGDIPKLRAQIKLDHKTQLQGMVFKAPIIPATIANLRLPITSDINDTYVYDNQGKFVLENIPRIDSKKLSEIFAYASMPFYPDQSPIDTQLDAAIIFHNLGLLTPEDAKITENPRFPELFLKFNGDMLSLRYSIATQPAPVATQTVHIPAPVATQTVHIPAPVATQTVHIPAPIQNDVDEDADDTTTSNKQLYVIFKELAAYYKLVGEVFKGNAFYIVSNIIKDLPIKITSLKDVKGIPKVGKSSLDVIDEYLKLGYSTRLNGLKAVNKHITDALETFIKIFGVGPVKAEQLYVQGCRTLEDVGKQKLTSAQELGVKYYYHFQQRISRDEVQGLLDRLSNNIFNINGFHWKGILDDPDTCELMGSYRRGETTCGDIDIAIRDDLVPTSVSPTENHPPKITMEDIRSLIEISGIWLGTLAQGPRKYMGIIQDPAVGIARRIDVRLFSKDEWAYALMYNTGSQRFNILMRQRALDLGVTMNEYGMKSLDGKTSYPAATEQDIFTYLGLKYLEPSQRTSDLKSLELV